MPLELLQYFSEFAFTKIAVHKLKYYGMWEQHMMTVSNCHEMWSS